MSESISLDTLIQQCQERNWNFELLNEFWWDQEPGTFKPRLEGTKYQATIWVHTQDNLQVTKYGSVTADTPGQALYHAYQEALSKEEAPMTPSLNTLIQQCQDKGWAFTLSTRIFLYRQYLDSDQASSSYMATIYVDHHAEAPGDEGFTAQYGPIFAESPEEALHQAWQEALKGEKFYAQSPSS